jgi:hypothetical protein
MNWVFNVQGPPQLALRTNMTPRWQEFGNQLARAIPRVEKIPLGFVQTKNVRDHSYKQGWPTCIATVKDGVTRCRHRMSMNRKNHGPRNGLCNWHGAMQYPRIDLSDLVDRDGRPIRRKSTSRSG